MTKQLKDILAGVKSSKISKQALGKDPGVDFRPHSGGEQDFADKHEIEKHEDRVGNGDDVYAASNMKRALLKKNNPEHGYIKPQDKKVYEAKKVEDTKCNNSAKGVLCETHGMAQCYDMKTIKEDEQVIDEKMNDVQKIAVRSVQTLRAKLHKDGHLDTKPSISDTKKTIKFVKNEEVESVNEEYMSEKDAERLAQKHVNAAILAKKAGNLKGHNAHAEASNDIRDSILKHTDSAKGIPSRKIQSTAKKLFGESSEHMIREDDDWEGQMAKTELSAICAKSSKLIGVLNDQDDLEAWVQSKISQAKMHIDAVHDYLVYGGEHKNEKDEQAPMDTPMVFPGMKQDGDRV